MFVGQPVCCFFLFVVIHRFEHLNILNDVPLVLDDFKTVGKNVSKKSDNDMIEFKMDLTWL